MKKDQKGYVLNFCPKCNQMTNHEKAGKCLKCVIKNRTAQDSTLKDKYVQMENTHTHHTNCPLKEISVPQKPVQKQLNCHEVLNNANIGKMALEKLEYKNKPEKSKKGWGRGYGYKDKLEEGK